MKPSCVLKSRAGLMSVHTLGSQQFDERHGFSWLDLLAPMDPQVPALPRTSQHLRGKRKRDFHSIKRYINLTAWQMCRLLEELVALDQQQLECAGSRAA